MSKGKLQKGRVMTTNVLTQSRVRIECPYPIKYINGLKIVSRVNEHSMLVITGVLHEGEGNAWLEAATSKDHILVYEREDTGEDIRLFSGVVSLLTLQKIGAVYHVEIEAMGWTSLLDETLVSRSFQDVTMCYYDLIQSVLSDYSDSAVICKPEDRDIGKFILQYRETDWSFLKRLATHFNTVLIADDLGNGPRFYLGIQKAKKEIEDIPVFVVWNDTERLRFVRSKGFDVHESDFTKYEIESVTRLSVGDCITFLGNVCVVEEAVSEFVNGLFSHKYILSREKGLLQPLRHNEQISGLSLLGNVIGTQNSSVRIHLRIDKKQDVDLAFWFPYAAHSNNVFYCMPEIGEKASLYFSNADESSGIAMNSVRSNGGNCSQTSNPRIKYMSIPSGQRIMLDETSLDFTEDEGQCIEIVDGKYACVQSPGNITICARSIKLNAAESVRFVADENMLVKSEASESQIFLHAYSENINMSASGLVKNTGMVRSRIPSFNPRRIAINRPPLPPPPPAKPTLQKMEARPWWQRGLDAVAAVPTAVVGGGRAVVSIATTGVTAMVAVCVGAGSAAVGAVSGGLDGAQSVMREGGSLGDIARGTFDGAVTGAVEYGIEGAAAVLHFAPGLIEPMFRGFDSTFSQVTHLTADTIRRNFNANIEVDGFFPFNGEAYEWILINDQSIGPASGIRMGAFEGYNHGARNGCGWISIYNASVLLGNPQHPAEIVRHLETNGGPVVNGMFGVYPGAIEDFFRAQGYDVNHDFRMNFHQEGVTSQTSRSVDDTIRNANVAILTYVHGNGAHFITIQYEEGYFVVYNDHTANRHSRNLGLWSDYNDGALVDSVDKLIRDNDNMLFSFSLITISDDNN